MVCHSPGACKLMGDHQKCQRGLEKIREVANKFVNWANNKLDNEEEKGNAEIIIVTTLQLRIKRKKNVPSEKCAH